MNDESVQERRSVLKTILRWVGLGALAISGGALLRRSTAHATVWQIDPRKCIGCGRCERECVLNPSAVKCVHSYAICGYCDLCSGYLETYAAKRDMAAENQLCPTGAIKRTFVEDPYFEYTIDEKLCIACGRCVRACEQYGNGSLYLQIRHDRCLNCNRCAIADHCPTNAIVRVSADQPYLLKDGEIKPSSSVPKKTAPKKPAKNIGGGL